MNKVFKAKVLSLRPEFAVTDAYFYYRPVGEILCGFLWENVRGHAYLWRFATPLYEPIDHLHLNFGERLPEPDGSALGFGTGRRAAVEFIRRIQSYEAITRAQQDPLCFLNCFEQYEQKTRANPDPVVPGRFVEHSVLQNPRVRRTIALTLILVGRAAEGRAHLECLLGDAAWLERYPHFIDDVHLVLKALDAGLDDARALLRTWEERTKRNLKIAQNS